MSFVVVEGRVYVAVDKKRLKQEYLLDQAQRDDSIPTLEEVIDYYRGDASTYEEEMSEEEFLAEAFAHYVFDKKIPQDQNMRILGVLP